VALNLRKDISVASDPVYHRKINFILFIFWGLIILICSVAVYLFILKESFGSFSAADLIPSEKSFQVFFNKQTKIALFYSDLNNMIIPAGSSLKEDFKGWEKFLDRSKLNYDIIGDEIIQKGSYFQYSLIILPQRIFLTDPQANRLKKFIGSGGSLFVSGEIGFKLNDSIIPGRSFLPEIFNMSLAGDTTNDSLKKNTGDQISVFRGGISLTSGIPAGYRMKISGENIKKTELRESKNQFQISFTGKNKNSGNFLSTAAYGVHEKGRVVWIGFDLGSIRLNEDKMIFEKFLSNAIRWLMREPIAYLRNYPPGYSAEAVIAPVLSDSIKNIYKVLKILSDENLKATFFIDPETSIENLGIVANLNKYGETALKINQREYSSLQINSLKKSKNIIEQITGNKCRGCIFLPENDIVNSSGIARRAGFGYLLSIKSSRINPEYFSGNRKEKIALFESRLYNSAESDPYKYDIDSISCLNDIFVFSFPLEEDYQIKNLCDIIRYLKEKNFYITTFSEIQDRFSKEQSVEVNAETKGGKRIFLHISNPSGISADEVFVDLDFNVISGISGLYINPEFVKPAALKVVDIDSRGTLNLAFRNFKPGVSQNYFIDYDTENF